MRHFIVNGALGVAVASGLLGASLVSHAHAAAKRIGYVPIIMTLPGSMSPGESGVGSVTLSGTPSQDTTVYLQASNSSCLTVPQTMTVYAGNSSGTFPVSVPTNASGGASVTGYANGGSASSSMMIISSR